jgi:predicted dehydrogenase
MKALIIGTGFGANVIAPVYAELGVETLMVSPHDDDAVRNACAGDVDLVSIHSPPFLHHRHVMWALDNGRAVLCDKPFGRNLVEARAMRDRAVATRVLHFLNFEFRFAPSRVKLKALLDEGAIGALQHINWQFFGNGLRKQAHRWLFDANLAGGWVGAYGSHVIDTLRGLCGSEVVDCGGVSRIETLERPTKQGGTTPSTAEDAFSAWFAFANGVTVNFDTAYSTPVAFPQRILLLGSEGALELVGEQTLDLRRPGEVDRSFVFDPPVGDPHLEPLRPWLIQVRDSLENGQAIAPNFDDGVATAEVMERLRAQFVRAGSGAAS